MRPVGLALGRYRMPDPHAYFCECMAWECGVRIPMTIEEYLRLHKPGHYVVAPGHQEPDDVVVSTTERYLLVREP